MLYAVSPTDLIPDFIPIAGALDDMTVVALATRFVRKDLEAYCRFKGHDPELYF